MMLTSLALALALPQMEALIQNLKDSRSDAEAIKVLVSADPQHFMDDLDDAVRRDAAFAPGTNARFSAFKVLAHARSVEVIGDKELKRIVNEKQLVLLTEGLGEKDYLIRSECVKSLPHWSSVKRTIALTRLSAALTDASPEVRITGCKAARTFGGEARVCLPILELLLRNSPEPEKTFDWHQPLWPSGETDDLEFRGRMEAAFARMILSSFAVDRRLYDELDAIGRDALVRAWSRFIYSAISEQAKLDPSWNRQGPQYAQIASNEEILPLMLQTEHYKRLDDSESSSLWGCIIMLVENKGVSTDMLAILYVATDQLVAAGDLSDEERKGTVSLKSLIDNM